MKPYITSQAALAFALLAFAPAWSAQYTLDLRAAAPESADAPVMRRASMPVSVGTISAVSTGDSIDLKLFDDVQFALSIVSAPPAGIAGQSFIAKDQNGSASAVVKVSQTKARISVDDFMNRRQYSVRVNNGIATIVERDNSHDEPGECGTCGGEIELPQAGVEETKSTSTKKSRTLLAASGNEFPLANQKSVVDILVAFDKGAKAWAEKGSNWGNGGDSIEEFADYAVSKMNMVLEKSQLLDMFSYRLAGVVAIDDTYTKIDQPLLENLRTRAGALAKLSQLRDKYGADTITLLINKTDTQSNTTGVGFGYYPVSLFPTPAVFDSDNYACNICDIKTVYSRYTMSHETGHNMGCDHSTRQGLTNSGPGRFADSSGYHFVDAKGIRRYTIMGYNYTADDDYNYLPIPYFSTPDISPEEYGCPLGTNGVHNNRRTLLQTYGDIAGLREHVLPYDWDVRFLDDSGNDIADGALFLSSCNVTLANSKPNATIYYTLDGSTPTSQSQHVIPGGSISVNLYSPKTLTACAVIDGVAQSVRSITLRDGLTWSGDENGNGVWTNTDSSERPWSGDYFYDDPVQFPDLSGISSATATVKDAVAPSSVSFSAVTTAYTFDKGGDDAKITIPDANFAPAGDVTFNVPVQLGATTFTNLTGCALTFNAPFGQTVDATSGYCTNRVTILPNGTMTVAPGAGKTQTFDILNNVYFAGSATFRVGEGTVIFNGAINGGAGVIGRTKLEVGNGGELVFNMGGGTGFEMNQTSLTVEKGGSVKFNDMEHLRRALYLDGGTIYAKRFDLVSNPGVYVTGDSSIVDNGGGYILIRNSDSEVNVSEGKTLSINLGTQTDSRGDTSGWGIIKRGKGTIVANKELKHSGVTDIEDGTIEVGYSSGSTAYGQGWIVASNSTLRVKNGCTLKVPSLALDATAILVLPVAESAPLVVTGSVSVANVNIGLEGATSLNAGAVYPLLRSDVAVNDVKSVKTGCLPTLAKELKWKIEVDSNVLCAKVVEKTPLEKAVDFCANDPSLSLAAPDDAVVKQGGGATITAKPYVVDGLNTKAVSIAVKFTVPETSPSSAAAICSFKLGPYAIHCMRAANGNFDCYWDALKHVTNATNTIALSPGDHVLQVGYYGEVNVAEAKLGTRVLLDGKVVYMANGLRFSSETVSRVAFGATAEDSPRYPYPGLVVRETAVLDALSSRPAPRMTTSGGDVEYAFHIPAEIPRIFPLTPYGAIAMKESLAKASFTGSFDALSISVMAAFPADAIGTIFGASVDAGLSNPYSTQVEYRGGGVLAFRDNGNDALKTSTTVDADMSTPHLYTLTYRKSEGYKLFLDGDEILSNDAYYRNKNYPVVARVSFGCGYWSNWLERWNDNPNPMSDLKIYASHIALGTDDPAVSETAVNESMRDSSDDDYPDAPETPATVDVLVAYDLGAQAYVSGKNLSLEDFASAQIQKMNDVLVTNRLERFYTYRFAGVCKVDDTYGNIDTAPALAAGGGGAMVSLRAAREIYGADTVTLLVDVSGNTLGNSSPLISPDNVASQHECAFSVCSIRAVDTGKQHTMIHENAHNMGCGHARAQPIINSPFSYGRGYYFQDGNVTRHTIMAYGGDNDASWYFSTSSSMFGFKLGDETNDNARVLRETCSEVAKWRDEGTIDLDGAFASGNAIWQTCKKYPWSLVGNTIRSYNQTDYKYQCTTPLKATVTGPAKLKFKHKSYFGGATLAGNNYSHFDVLLDDSPVMTQTECTNSWTDAVVEIPDGVHEVTFVFSQRFAMNNSGDYKDGAPEADDAVWLKDISIMTKPVKTDDNFEVPGTDGWVFLDHDEVSEWLEDQNFKLSYGGDMTWQEFMEETGANGYYNWENFLLGYSAEDSTQKFSAKIKVVDGQVTVETTEGVIPSGYGVVKRLFKKTTLDGEWDPPEGEVMSGKSATMEASGQGFYKVKVAVEPDHP